VSPLGGRRETPTPAWIVELQERCAGGPAQAVRSTKGDFVAYLCWFSPREPRSAVHSAYLTDPEVGSLRPVAPSRVTVTRAGGLTPRVGGPRRRAPLGSGPRPADTESADGN
jgi:hypothetical protein